ncbi:hypothetical protein EBR78_09285, partial [bacterium]|nr:hypothetical protein [bacterium]
TTKKNDLGTAISSLQTKINEKGTEYTNWNTAAAQELVESARNKRLLGTRLSTAESEALNYEESYQKFVVDSNLLKLSLEAEKLFFEDEIADLSATPPTVVGLTARNSQLEVKRGDLGALRVEIERHRDRIRRYDGRIDDIDRQLLRLTRAAGLTIDPLCARLNPPPASN